MANDKTRTDAWESCLTEEQLAFLHAWCPTSAYDVKDVFLGKVRVCHNPACRKKFKQMRSGQKFCTRECGRLYRRQTYDRQYRILHRKEIRAFCQLYWVERNERLESDPQEYARVRELKRLSNRRWWERHHPNCKPYTPLPCRRIPDWAVKGQEIIDRGSVFLPGNMSDEKVEAANAYALEQFPDAGENRPRVKTIFRSR